MFIRNCWYLAGHSGEIAAGAPLARRLLDEPVVLWRTGAGELVALLDRCSHRMAPLSKGRQEGDTLRCMYHGLRFDSRGACVEAPCQSGIPSNLRVRSFPVVERTGLIWIWMGEAALADPDEVPDFDWLFSPDWTGEPAYMHYEANFELVRDNILDLSHVAFVHGQTLASSDAAATIPPELERFPWGLRLTNWHPNEPLPPHYEGIAPFTGPIDRWFVATAFAKGNVAVIEAGSAPAGEGVILVEAAVDTASGREVASHAAGVSAEYPRLANTLRHCILHVLTPETENSTHYFYNLRRRFALGDEALTRTLAERFETAFLEDKVMIEAQARNIDPDAHMQVIRSDAALLHMRRLTRKMIEQENGSRSGASTRQPKHALA
jgi:phenylpropionate dioxygenase-like ring-hydroxylating dioxygenase large terminal subunit